MSSPTRTIAPTPHANVSHANVSSVDVPNATASTQDMLAQLGRVPIENVAIFFERLIRKLDNVSSMDGKERWLAYLGLRAIYSEAQLSRFDRDIVMIQATWKMLKPLLREHGMLLEYAIDADLRDRVDRFIHGHPPVVATKAKRRAQQRQRLRLRSAALAQTDSSS